MMRVVNRYKEPFDVYIGRGTPWGNHFIIGLDGDREEVIRKYKVELWGKMKKSERFCRELLTLDGKVLGCSCKPQACHGDVIVNAIEWLKAKFKPSCS